MKILNSLLFLLFLFSIPLQAQLYSTASPVDTTIGYHYKVAVEVPLYQCNLLGKQTDSAMYEAPIGATFTHIGNSGNNVIIRFWNWAGSDSKSIPYNYTDSTKKQKSYFLMNKTDFMSKTKQRYSKRPSFALGTAAVPFKIRTTPFNFSTDVALGSVAGAKFRMNPYTDENFYNVLVGFGISNVALDSTSTNGTIGQNSIVQNTASFTLSIGGVLEFSNVQVGAFVGWDLINNNDKVTWSYHGKPWVSLGIGYSLFTKTSKNTLMQAGNNY